MRFEVGHDYGQKSKSCYSEMKLGLPKRLEI